MFIWTVMYVEWVCNIVSVTKKKYKIISIYVYIDFRHLNIATLKDKYHITKADMLIDVVTDNEMILSLLYKYFDYTKIFMVESDISKKGFCFSGCIGNL